MRIPKRPPPLAELLREEAIANPAFLTAELGSNWSLLVERANHEGWNWEECSYRAATVGLTPRQFWLMVKLSRSVDRRMIPLRDKENRPFSYRLPPDAIRMLHEVDKHLGGNIGAEFPQLSSEKQRQNYVLTSLREEAISSSLIEGAVATRSEAAEMIRQAREPRTHGERMIVNNYQTIRFLNSQKDQPLTPDLLLTVQSLLTQGTMKDDESCGRFRRTDEDISVWDDEQHQALHIPPAASELAERTALMCRFGNESDRTTETFDYVHPAIRAIILHFWLAYDHPFVDGNGRSARALFYWCMLKNGYWLTEYLTISTIIANQPKQYVMAYLNTETDGNDLTYFILYHLKVLAKSVEALREYLARKTAEQRQELLLASNVFNTRQRALLQRAIRDPLVQVTHTSHANSHGISIATARIDLLELEEMGLLRSNRKGRSFVFQPVSDIEERIRKITDPR